MTLGLLARDWKTLNPPDKDGLDLNRLTSAKLKSAPAVLPARASGALVSYKDRLRMVSGARQG